VFLVMVTLTGCGASAARKPARTNTRQAAEHALQLWSRYPVTSPRPVLLIEGSVLPPVDGFGTGDAKLAFLQGRYVLRAPLAQAPTRLRGWRVISARQALEVWHSQSSEGPAPPKTRLAITGMRLATASFSTERGQRILPAWAFSVRGLDNPVDVLALPDSRVFIPPTPWDGENATVSDRGRMIRVGFVGGHAGNKPCDDSYTVGSVADNHAVAFWIVDHPVKTGRSLICSTVGYPRIVVIRLEKPLGARALVNSYGAPVPACLGQRPPPLGGMETCRDDHSWTAA
jgi:hypothetical protein